MSSMRRMLVIDDSLTARMRVKEILESDGIQVTLCSSAEEGTTLATKTSPDVILLDVVLPGIDGIELCHAWRSVPELKEIPVLLMSGERSDRDDRAAGLRAGAMGYVVKPFNKSEMLAQVNLLHQLGKTHKELKHQVVLAQSASETKSRFLANMSHEIRTPLTSILGFAEGLLDSEISDDERLSAVKTILRNGKHLLEVISDILDISKIEAGKLLIERIECSPIHLLNDVMTLMSPKAIEKHLTLEVEYEYPLPRRIYSDPTRLKQILLNLVSNALKFTSKGKIKISVSCDRVAGIFVMKVTDSGIGMSEEEQRNLFKAFNQADASTVRKFGGTGLGLAISRELTESLGGKISVESTPGVGSTFTAEVAIGDISTFELIYEAPTAISSSQDSRGQQNQTFKGKILVVEDDEDIRKLLIQLLRKLGLETEFAENGVVGIEKAMTGAFDIIFMDMQMPVMDGYTAAKELRSKGYLQPIVAVTGNVMHEEVERLLTAGCTEHLAKPFERVRVIEVLNRYLVDKKTEDRENVEEEDPEILALTRSFVEGLSKRISAITAAYQSKDYETMHALAHRLAGAGLFGFNDLGAAALQLENSAKDQDENKIQVWFLECENLIKKVVAEQK